MSKNEQIDKLFEGCRSNLEAPLIGRVFKPSCYQCKNLIEPANPFRDCTCAVYGELPAKYWLDDKERCPHKTPND